MTEILTESFCERCGTRYTFESTGPRKSRVGKVRVLSKGLRNFVLSDETTLSEAMADARSEEELAATTHQLDAFHKTFNFCLSCRQYTCSTCWNEIDGRCLSCAPIPGRELPAEPAAEAVGAVEAGPGSAEALLQPVDEAWPEVDLTRRLEMVAGEAAVPSEGITPVEAGAGGDGAASDALEPAAAIAADQLEAEAVRPPTAPAVAAAGVVVAGQAPGQSLEEAVAAYEAALDAEDRAAAEAAVGLEPVAAHPTAEGVAAEAVPAPALADVEPVAAEPEPEPVAAAAEPVPVAAEPVPEPALVAEPEPEPVATAEPEPEPLQPAAAAGVDIVEQPVWPTSAPAGGQPVPAAPQPETAPAEPGWLTVAPDDGASPRWPAGPAWGRATSTRPDVQPTLAGRPLLPQGDAAAVWAASAQEVMSGGPAKGPSLAASAAPTAQPCISCGLSLSANARFCRRCGTRQG